MCQSDSPALIVTCLVCLHSMQRAQSVWTCATECREAASDIQVGTKILYPLIMSEMKNKTSSEVLTGANNDQTFSLLRRESPDQRLSSRYNMHDLLSAGFIPLTLDKQSKKVDPVLAELPRGFHPVYTSIEYKCASPLYRHTGSSRRTCLKTGRWSGRHVSCSPGESSSCEDLANRNAGLKGSYVR